MSLEDNKALVRAYVDQIVNAGNLERLGDFVTPDYRRYLSPGIEPLSPDTQRQRLAGLRAAFPDLRLLLEDVIAEEDRVAFRGTLSATHQGPFQGIPATGRRVTIFASDIVRIRDGKLSEHWGGPDLFSLVQQLGAVISPAAKT
jgi:predicted ester cyclase